MGNYVGMHQYGSFKKTKMFSFWLNILAYNNEIPETKENACERQHLEQIRKNSFILRKAPPS